jgi:hypothetical protein
MPAHIATPATAFLHKKQLAVGDLGYVALQVKTLLDHSPDASVLIFSDEDGKVVDVDFRGGPEEVMARLPDSPRAAQEQEEGPRGPGRPRLGVVAREVTLLPRHWEWLATQPGGASVALRKLVEEARRASSETDRRRQSQEAAYRFMSAMAGDEAGFEDATRALFAGKPDDFDKASVSWPEDVRRHAQALAASVFVPS